MVERYFFVFSIGHSGSAWLAKILNSHFDAICFHELELAPCGTGWPVRGRSYYEYSRDEKLCNLCYLFTRYQRYGDSYRALGAACNHVLLEAAELQTALSGAFPEEFPKARLHVLLRHPTNQIASHAKAIEDVARGMADRSPWHACYDPLAARVLPRLPPMVRQKCLPILQDGPLDLLSFVHACLHYIYVVDFAGDLSRLLPYSCRWRLESLVETPESLREALHAITGLDYALPAQAFEKVNVKSGANSPDIVRRSWDGARTDLFDLILEARAEKIRSLGYVHF